MFAHFTHISTDKCHKKTLCWVHLHMITILGRLPAKGESTRWPNPKFNPSSLLDNCRPELVSQPTHLVALVPKPSEHHQGLKILLPTDLSELELVSAWLAAWAVVVVLQTTDFKRKARGQTKLGLKTQEERSRRALCAHAHVSPGAQCLRRGTISNFLKMTFLIWFHILDLKDICFLIKQLFGGKIQDFTAIFKKMATKSPKNDVFFKCPKKLVWTF